MSTVPTINEVQVLPSQKISIRFTPQTDTSGIGGSITSYSARIVSGATTHTANGLTARTHENYSYLLRVQQLPLGASWNVFISANGPGGSVESAAVAVNMATVQFAWEEAVRQLIAEVIIERAITVGTAAYVYCNQWGLARAAFKEENILPESFPVIEVGQIPIVGFSRASRIRYVQACDVPVRLIVAHQNPEDGTDLLRRLRDRVIDALEDSNDMDLTAFGVPHRTWDYEFEPRIVRHKDSLLSMGFNVIVGLQIAAGTKLGA